MFDIGFWELVLISLLSLVIVGPQRLPETIRTLFSWWRRAKQVTTEVGSKLESELGLNEVNTELSTELKRVQQPLAKAINTPRVKPRVSQAAKANNAATASTAATNPNTSELS